MKFDVDNLLKLKAKLYWKSIYSECLGYDKTTLLSRWHDWKIVSLKWTCRQWSDCEVFYLETEAKTAWFIKGKFFKLPSEYKEAHSMNHSLIDHCCSLTPTFFFATFLAASLCTVQDPITAIFITFEFKTTRATTTTETFWSSKLRKP